MMRTIGLGLACVVALASLPVVGCGDDDTGGNGGQGAAPTASGGGGSGAQGGSGANGGAPTCDPSCEQQGHLCCGTRCLNGDNDILHCGDCDTECEGRSPFCDNGTCGPAPCDDPMACGVQGICCGALCCEVGYICCVVPGPGGPQPPRCVNPDDHGGTCPTGF